ncbi:MAG: DUF3885 domain-containing protein [Bacteroidota bacterium]
MKNTLRKEMKRLMPDSGLESIHGKFYMRFELGGEGNSAPLDRITQATLRGTKIFNEVIGPGEVIVVIQEWKSNFFDPYKRNEQYLYKILGNIKLNKTKGPFEQTYFEIDKEGRKQEKVFNDPLECDILTTKTTLDFRQIESIIRGIASVEMGEDPCVTQSVYFFSVERHTGFNIYDDRGCDVWANSLEVLRPAYVKLNSWILNYNRREIDKMFASSS